MSDIPMTADTLQIDGLGREFQRQAPNVLAIVTAIDSALSSTNWQGRAANNFKQMWDSEWKPTLRQLEDALDGEGTTIHRQAEAYRQADSAAY